MATSSQLSSDDHGKDNSNVTYVTSNTSIAPARLRVLFLTLEFIPAFSGNGTLSQCAVRKLLECTGDIEDVLIVCGCPAAASEDGDVSDSDIKSAELPLSLLLSDGTRRTLNIVRVPLPVWFRLDRTCAWQAFANGVINNPDAVDAVRAFASHVVCGVDWTSLAVWQRLRDTLYPSSSLQTPPPYVFFTYRLFHRNVNDLTDDDRTFYRTREYDAARTSAHVVSLCEDDARNMRLLLQSPSSPPIETTAGERSGGDDVDVSVLHCPLRMSMESLALAMSDDDDTDEDEEDDVNDDVDAAEIDDCKVDSSSLAASSSSLTLPPPSTASEKASTCRGSRRRRLYFACVVRLSREKNVHVFVDVCVALASLLKARGIVPFLCGAACDVEYASTLKQRLRASFDEDAGECVVRDFLTPPALADVFSRTLLNFHPALYEAYGMSIVEAAAFRAPSLIHHAGIGCYDRLCESESVFRCDMTLLALTATSDAVSTVRALFASQRGRRRLRVVGAAARRTALDWNETAYQQGLVSVLRRVQAQHQRHSEPQ